MSFIARVSGYLMHDAKHAVNDKYTQTTFTVRTHKADKSGTFTTIFIDVACYGKLAEKFARLEKRDHVLVEGHFWNRSYVSREGMDKVGYNLTASEIYHLSERDPDPQPVVEQAPIQQEALASDDFPF